MNANELEWVNVVIFLFLVFLLPIKDSSNIIGALHAKNCYLPCHWCVFSLEKISQDENDDDEVHFMRYLLCDLGSMNSFSTNHWQLWLNKILFNMKGHYNIYAAGKNVWWGLSIGLNWYYFFTNDMYLM